MFKVNNENTRTTSMTPFWCFIVNFEHISPLCYLLKANNGNTRFNFEQNSHIVPVFFMDDFKQVKRS